MTEKNIQDPRKATKQELYDALSGSGKEWADKTALRMRNEFWILFIAWVVAIVIIALLMLLKPVSEDWGKWFQRSGSIIVVLAILAEIKIKNIERTVFSPNPWGVYCEIYIEKKFSSLCKTFGRLTWLAAAIGTVIWGYGDVIWVMVI